MVTVQQKIEGYANCLGNGIIAAWSEWVEADVVRDLIA